jgi:predicted ATPase
LNDAIQQLTIEGFKSIRKLENFELRNLNVLIGANGAGKSNFVSFFRLVREMAERRLQVTLQKVEGGADAVLHLGPKVTAKIRAELVFENSAYGFDLAPTPDNRLVFSDERLRWGGETPFEWSGAAHFESELESWIDEEYENLFEGPHPPRRPVRDAISSWALYHLQDTGPLASARRQRPINDNERLRPDGENLAAILFNMRERNPGKYGQIRDVLRLAAPFFDDFKLRPATNPDLIQLEWTQKDSDYPFLAHQLSDGTLRFICLVTAILQPSQPSTMLFDEPELGLHPYAVTLLGELLKEVSASTQVIVSTQSALLLNEFEPEDVIVVERHDGESLFRRLAQSQLSEWLQDYSLGELWQKNVLGGTPGPENAPQLAPGGAKVR